MSDLISRSQAMEDVGSLTITITGLRAEKSFFKTCLAEYRKNVLKILDEQPPVEAKPVVHGEWISFDEEANGWQCSRCGNIWQLNDGTPEENNMNFCTNCGARMVKVNE